MLRRIGLSNFKCWKELDIELAPITLLFGTNSSGKTALLQSLLMLKQTARGIDPGQHINFGGSERDYADLGSFRDVAFENIAESKLGVLLGWDSSQSGSSFTRNADGSVEVHAYTIRSIEFDVAWGLDTAVYIDKLRYDTEFVDTPPEWIEVCRKSADEYRWKSSDVHVLDSESRTQVSSPSSCYILPWEITSGPLIAGLDSIANLAKEFVRMINHIEYLGPLRIRPKRYYDWTGTKPDKIEPDGANAIQALIASSRGDEFLANDVALGLKRMDIVDAFGIRTISELKGLYEITARIGGLDNSLTDVGFGVSQVLPVITMLMSAPKGSIILLEQPELHLHPNAQAALADLMLEVAERRNLQLIVESHSEHIVRRLQRRIAEASPAFATPENIKMYYCQPAEGGATIDEVDVDRFGQISNWPEKFMGDISGDIHSMAKAAIQRRRQELERVGSGG